MYGRPESVLDVGTSQRRGRSLGRVVGRYGVSSLREKKMTVSREAERHRTVHRGNATQRPELADRRVMISKRDRLLVRGMRLAGESGSASAVG